MNEDKINFTSSIEKNLSQLFSLSGRIALVTGGASGLGKRIGTTLAAVGATVYFADIDEQGVTDAVRRAREVGLNETYSMKLDVTKQASVRSAFQKVNDENGRLDILICSAGTSGSKWIEDMSLDLWNRVLEVNLTGTFLCCREAVSMMIPQKWGRIVPIASMAATYVPRPEHFNGGYNYSASKAGVKLLTKRLSVELAPHNITVNSISPGWIETPLTEKAVSDMKTFHKMIESIPLRRVGAVSDLDGLLVYLCSESSGYLTGQDILIDGGYSVW